MLLNSVADAGFLCESGTDKRQNNQKNTLFIIILIGEVGGKHFRPFLWCEIQVFVLFLYCIALHAL